MSSGVFLEFLTLPLLLFLLLLSQRCPFAVGAVPENWCVKEAQDCYFDLEVDYGLTMMHRRDMVKAVNGSLYRYDVTDYDTATKYPIDDIITADGYLEPKMVMTFNGTIPGPALHMYHGQRVHLRVTNKLLHETTTVHIHGQHQRGTPYSDGVPFVTQCPIMPGQTFTQIFEAEPTGTFFYHSHSGPQMDNGLYGAFIVHPREPERFNIAQLDPHKTVFNNTDQPVDSEHVLIIQDYNHDWEGNMITQKMNWGIYKEGKKIPGTKHLADIDYSLFLVDAGLINGRARFYDKSGSHNGAPLSVFTVSHNTLSRLRLVNSGDVHPFRMSIDGHKLLVISSDGYELEPILVDHLIIHPGERFDVIILTNQTPGNFYIRGYTLEVGMENRAEAILNYEGIPEHQNPTSVTVAVEGNDECDPDHPTVVLNCPFSYYPKDSCSVCRNFGDIRAATPGPIPITNETDFQEYFLNFAFPGYSYTPGSANGRKYVSHPSPPLTQPGEDTLTCSTEECGEDKLCYCPHTVDVKRNAVVQLVFTNIGSGKGWDHPVHLHGHSFQVVKMGYPSYDNATGKFLDQTQDIKCNGNFCNEASWRDPSWARGNIPGAEVTRPPYKDNVLVPSGGYVVARFKADNPGLWIVHCHIGLHANDGMAALVSEDRTNWPARPKGFPTCGNYDPDRGTH